VHWQPYFKFWWKLICIRRFHIYCPIWVEFGINDLYITLLCICEHRRREGRTLLAGISLCTQTAIQYSLCTQTALLYLVLQPAVQYNCRTGWLAQKLSSILYAMPCGLVEACRRFREKHVLWWYRQHVPLRRQYTSSRLHGVTTTIFMITTVTTSNRTTFLVDKQIMWPDLLLESDRNLMAQFRKKRLQSRLI